MGIDSLLDEDSAISKQVMSEEDKEKYISKFVGEATNETKVKTAKKPSKDSVAAVRIHQEKLDLFRKTAKLPMSSCFHS